MSAIIATGTTPLESVEPKIAVPTDSGQATPEQQPIQQTTRRKSAAVAAPPAPPDGGSPNADCPFANRRWQHKTTYAALIAVAIYTSPRKRLRMEQIYGFIEAHRSMIPVVSHPNWKNSIRHNLSLRQCFKKVPQLSSDGKRLRSYWELDTGCLPAAAEEMIHVVTKMQRKSGNDARGAQWFQKHCGWDVTEDDDAEEIGHMMHSHHQRGDITQPMIVYPGGAMHPMQGGLPGYPGMPQMMYPGMPGMPPQMMQQMHMAGYGGPRGAPPGMPGFYGQPAGGYPMVPMQGPRGMQMVPMPGYRPPANQQQMAAMYASMQAAQPVMGQAAPVPPPDVVTAAAAAQAAKQAAPATAVPPVVKAKVEETDSDADDDDDRDTSAKGSSAMDLLAIAASAPGTPIPSDSEDAHGDEQQNKRRKVQDASNADAAEPAPPAVSA